jgi:hypothetical protein
MCYDVLAPRCAILCGVARLIRSASTLMLHTGLHVQIPVGVLVLCAALLALPAGAGKAAYPDFVPAPDKETAPQLDGVTWVTDQPAYAVRLTKVGNEPRQKYIRSVTGADIDPFAARPDEPPRYISFLLQIKNRTDGRLVFNPLQCWLFTNQSEILTPMGLSDLAFLYRTMEQELPAAYEQVDAALLGPTRVINSQASLHGLLVYRAPKGRTKNFKIDVQFTLPTGDVVKISAPYDAVRGKKK